ncbi:MAG TPA: helix-turn-helix domain-containing protein [Aldersonia sp.]
MHWTQQLAGTRSHETELKWLGLDAERVRADIGDGAVAWAVEVGERITERIARVMPPLGESEPLFRGIRRATTATTMRALALIAGLDEPHTSLAGVDLVEISRDFARRGLELNDLLRAIRVGYAVLAAAHLDAATELVPQSECITELRRISVLLFEVLDDFTGVAAEAFVEEQNAWAASVSAARLDVVKNIIDAVPIDLAHAEPILDYPLRGQHLALIAWIDSSQGLPRKDLRDVVEPVLRCWGTPIATLVVPVGSHTMWAWGAIGVSLRRGLHSALPRFDGINIVAGHPGDGLDGFRTSHLEAASVEQLVRLRATSACGSTAHEDVDLEVLLLADPAAARRYAVRHLGPLADDDPRMTELRVTLRNYLDLDRSLAKVAVREHIARNTVTYRVQQALTLCAHPPGAPTTALSSALRILDWLDGPASH